MAQSDARFGYQAKLSREDHDLAAPFGFTCCPGMELPIFADVASAGDYFEVKHDLPFLRTNPLSTPAMVDVKIHFETFFVPFMMLFQPYENVFYSLKNYQSSKFAVLSAPATQNAFPLFGYNSFIENIKQNWLHGQERQDAFRLADMLRLQAENFCEWHGDESCPWRAYHPNFFPWQLLAYHTIWYYYFRLDDKSDMNNTLCNWDQFYDVGDSPVEFLNTDFMKVHARPWNFDYYSSIYRSPIVSPSNTYDLLPLKQYQPLVAKTTFSINESGDVNNANVTMRAFSSGVGANFDTGYLQAAISTASIRQMFANEKLAMITGRTRKNYDSQVLAHLGVKVPTDVKHDLQLIGRDTYDLRIGEVTSLASTDGTPLGDLAGKGWASSRNGQPHKVHKFKAPVDGVIMTLFCVEPLKRYFGGFARQNAVTDAFDLPRPEFDRLGNVPMFGYEVGASRIQNATIIGWKERYYQWKRRSPYTTLAFAQPNLHQGDNTWSAYMLAQRPFASGTRYTIIGNQIGQTYEGPAPEEESSFYIPFNALDNIMLEAYQYGWLDINLAESSREDWDNMPWLVYSRDPIIVDAYPTVKKVSWMSKDGEPIYPY